MNRINPDASCVRVQIHTPPQTLVVKPTTTLHSTLLLLLRTVCPPAPASALIGASADTAVDVGAGSARMRLAALCSIVLMPTNSPHCFCRCFCCFEAAHTSVEL